MLSSHRWSLWKEKTCSATEVKVEKKEDNCEQIAGALPSNADDDLHVAGVCVCVLVTSGIQSIKEGNPAKKKPTKEFKNPGC